MPGCGLGGAWRPSPQHGAFAVWFPDPARDECAVAVVTAGTLLRLSYGRPRSIISSLSDSPMRSKLKIVPIGYFLSCLFAFCLNRRRQVSIVRRGALLHE
jgi:hypothetical protein